MFDDERNLRRRIERTRAYDGDAFDRLAGAIDVALSVDECGVAVAADAIAGNIERREIDFGFAEDEETVVVAFLHDDHERRLRRFRQLREIMELPQSARIGA